MALLRRSETTHFTCMHGCGAPEMFKAQPAMVNVSDERRMKSPPALARLFALTADTVPPCGHIIELEGVNRCGIATSLDPPSVVVPSARRSLEDSAGTEEL